MDQELADVAAYAVHSPDSSTSAWNDVMATILYVWHHIKNRTL